MQARLLAFERIVFAMGLVLLAAACTPSLPESATSIESAQLVLGAERPSTERFGGMWVELPDGWPATRRRIATEGWYRMNVELRAGDELLGVLVTGARLNAEIFFNGTSLGRVGRFEPPLARAQPAPLYYPVPPVLVRDGRNEIEIHLATTQGFPGRLEPVWVGPDRDLRRIFEREHLIDVQGPRSAIFLAWLMALAMFGEAYALRSDRRAFIFLGTAALAMAISGTGFFVTEIPLPSRLWEWLAGSLGHWAAFLLLLSVHRFLGISRPTLERSLFAAFALTSAIFAAVPYVWAFAVWVAWLAGTLLVYGYLLVLLMQGVRRGQLHQAVPVVAFLVIAPWVGMATGGLMLAAALGAWLLLARTYRRIRQSEAQNLELSARVAEREREVRASYERLRELEHVQIVNQERERLMRDMHDGTGGHLVSALAMARNLGPEGESVAGILQAALDELRLTIESLDPDARDVPSVLGMMRANLERRLAPAGTRLVWQVGDAGSGSVLASEDVLHLVRIVQEAVTNVIKHARASALTIRTATVADGSIVVGIHDDGSSVVNTSNHTGRGLGNMRSRAASMGGRLDVASGPDGTSVDLTFPRQRDQSSERTIPS
jgi:signal transduction histidine kinase